VADGSRNGRGQLTAVKTAACFLAMFFGAAFASPADLPCNLPPPSQMTTLPLPGHPFQAAFSKDGCWAFVSLLTNKEPEKFSGVAVLRRTEAGLELVRSIELHPGPVGMVVTHDGELLIAANGQGIFFLSTASLISGRGQPIVATIRENPSATTLFVSVTRDDKYVFASEEGENTITVVDLARVRARGNTRNPVVGKIPVGEGPVALTFSSDEHLLYTTSERALPAWGWPNRCDREDPEDPPSQWPEGAVVVVDVERAKRDPAGSVLGKLEAGCSPVHLAMSPLGDRAYVTARKDDAVAIFDPRMFLADPAHARVGTVSVGTAPVPILVLDQGKRLVVGNSNRFGTHPRGTETLSVLDTSVIENSGNATVGSIPAGEFPRALVVSPDGRLLLLANFGSSSLQLMDPLDLPIDKSGR
jgi:DNA-binding beta-propeller fold protein YncE